MTTVPQVGLTPSVVVLLDRLVAPEARWLFLRRTLDAHDLPADVPRSAASRPDWAAALAAVPSGALFQYLRERFPEELVRIDVEAACLLPVSERLGRVAPVAPADLCLVGRTELVDAVLVHPEWLGGTHLHLHGPRLSGRSLVAAQVARHAADRFPVVAWLDGRSAAGVQAGLDQLFADLGGPTLPVADRARSLNVWLRSVADWLVVVDDAPDVLPRALLGGAGRLLTTGIGPRADARVNVALPNLDAPARATVAKRWSRGRCPDLPAEWPVGSVAVVAAAFGTGTTPEPTVQGAWRALSEDARALDGLLRAFAPAPVPFPLLVWPPDVSPPDRVPQNLRPLFRSTRVLRAAAADLVRGACAQWVGEGLRRGSGLGEDILDTRASAMAAELVIHALQTVDRLPALWRPHVSGLSDDPRVPAHLRRALATRAGRLALQQADPQAAVEWFQRALAAVEGDPGMDPRNVASLLNDLGVAWRRAGRLDDAASVFRDALSRDTQLGGADPLSTASTQTNLGHVLREQGHMREARDLYLRAHSVREELQGTDHRDTAAVAIQLGVTHRALGALDEARRAWTHAVHGLSRLRPTDRILLAAALQHLAELEADAGRVADAVKLAERAHGLLMVEYDDIDHPEVVRLRQLVSRLDTER